MLRPGRIQSTVAWAWRVDQRPAADGQPHRPARRCLSRVSVDYEQMGPQLYLRSASYDSSRQFSVSVSRPTQRKTAPFGTCEVQSISRCYTKQLYETCPAASGTKDIGTADAGAPAACVRPASPRSRCAARPDPDT